MSNIICKYILNCILKHRKTRALASVHNISVFLFLALKFFLNNCLTGQRSIWSFEVTYLPPLCVHCTLPNSYPSSDPPSYAVSCVWMSPKQLTLVCQELDRLWTESSGMPILFSWIDWLQENLLRYCSSLS